MMRSLYSGISGLRNHQTRMDVIGNNIANVNTVGYKTSRVVFQEIFTQTMQGGTANTGVRGGTNAMQIGLGVRLATIDVLHTRSAAQRTDNPTDLMINGDGFFILGSQRIDDDGVPIPGVYDRHFTRSGNFLIDNDGYLVSSHGLFVMGLQGVITRVEIPAPAGAPAGTGPTMSEWFNASEPPDTWPEGVTEALIIAQSEFTADDFVDGSIPPRFGRIFVGGLDLDAFDTEVVDGIETWVHEDSDELGTRLHNFAVDRFGTVSVLADGRQIPIAQLLVAAFPNPAGLERVGDSLFAQTRASGDPLPHAERSADPDELLPGWQFLNPGDAGAGEISSGTLEMSNVDLASEFTDMIVTQRGFQANSRVITVSDTMLEELVNLKR
ncbi:MAG: flagellar hook-basal body complex protein [Oscillospiraceae bacterium]|nr:flagellar hook-basal body complex protein [Oscillospiraceae bacterium]